MADGDTGVGDILMDHFSDVGKVADAVVDEINLTVSRHLEIDGVGDDLCTKGVNLRLDGITVRGRRLDDTEITGSDERELEGTGNGRGRHRESVDIRLHLTQFLLGTDAELLLLVDDEQTKILKLHRLADELMRTYDNINLPLCQVFQQSRSLFTRFGTGEVVHTHGHILQTRGEGTKMLIGQHRGRHEHGHLLAVGSSLEGSTYGHLSLAKAHITADKTVHGTGTFHVGLHVLSSLQLVRGVFIKEAGLEFVLHIAVGTEGKTLFTATLGVELNQVAGNILDMLLRTLLQPFPLACTEGGETGRLTIVLRLILRHLI